ncbi:MAG: lipopolysaccharide heptosyltransferase II [Desulfobacteraceae bacterium]|nr:lipopolysaccharide heptosyltransferase II [Desulfobacteraceae bacterium]
MVAGACRQSDRVEGRIGRNPQERKNAIRSVAFAHIRNLLVRGVNWIGDAVMTTPALASLRSAFPHARITMLVKPWVAPVYENNPHLDRVLLYRSDGRHAGPAGLFRLARDIKRLHFDAALLLQNAFEAAWIAMLAGIPMRIGYDTDARRLLLTHPIRRSPRVRKGHQTGYYQGILQGMGFRSGNHRLQLVVGDKDKERADALLRRLDIGRDAILLGINPSAAFGPAKQWPPQRFARLADRLRRQVSGHVLLFGGPGDRRLGEQVAAAMTGASVNLAGQTRLGEAMALIERCRFFVTNDSGLMHVAAALDTPQVAIFGSTDPRATGPWSNAARIVTSGEPCAPCLKPVCPLGHLHCMERIGVDRVWAAVQEML